KHDDEREDRAEAGNVHAEPGVRAPVLRHEQHRLVQHVDDHLQDPDRDHERDPDEQAGDQVFLHGIGNRKARLAPGRGRGLAAGLSPWPRSISTRTWIAAWNPSSSSRSSSLWSPWRPWSP